MKRFVGAAATGLVLLGALAVTVIPASSARTEVPSVLTCAGKTTVKPSSYVLACADANTYFNSVHWTKWTAQSAKGTATFVQNNCAPTCAEGKFIKYPATLVLSVPKSTNHGLLFSRISYSYMVSASTTLPLKTLAEVAGHH